MGAQEQLVVRVNVLVGAGGQDLLTALEEGGETLEEKKVKKKKRPSISPTHR